MHLDVPDLYLTHTNTHATFFLFFFASAYIVTHSNILNNIYSLPSDKPKLVVPSHTLQSSARQAKDGSSHSHTTIIRQTKLAVPTHTLQSSGIQSWQFPLIHYIHQAYKAGSSHSYTTFIRQTKLAVPTHTLHSSGKQSW